MRAGFGRSAETVAALDEGIGDPAAIEGGEHAAAGLREREKGRVDHPTRRRGPWWAEPGIVPEREIAGPGNRFHFCAARPARRRTAPTALRLIRR